VSDPVGPEPGTLRRVFGSGPAGAAASVALLLAAAWLQARMQWPAMGLSHGLRLGVLALGTLAAVATIAWSVRSLPVETRGRQLCTRGPFAWVRHPLYAAFLVFFCPAFAVYLDQPAYLAWAVALHPLWHGIIRGEERLMEERFGGEWRRYAARTGRFVPRRLRRAGETA
jgi:protein-S-isoprenylcysteine O-methyltransferase Ste14